MEIEQREKAYKKLDLLAYKHLEEEMLDFGSEMKSIDKELSEWRTHPENLRMTMLDYTKRLRWLNKIGKEINFLYAKVDRSTKEVIIALYIENLTFKQAGERVGKSVRKLKKLHGLIVHAIADNLGMLRLNEETIRERSRYIPADVKKEVWERYKGSCASCGSGKNIHYHHINYFSEGGKNTAENLMLLCSSCHAEEHKGERVYRVMKAVAEG